MPVLKRRSEHVRVYRPNGTRYTQGRGYTPEEAIANARGAWQREFGSEARQEYTVFEIVGVTADWVCDLFEVKE